MPIRARSLWADCREAAMPELQALPAGPNSAFDLLSLQVEFVAEAAHALLVACRPCCGHRLGRGDWRFIARRRAESAADPDPRRRRQRRQDQLSDRRKGQSGDPAAWL